jgi:hypothetical protein
MLGWRKLIVFFVALLPGAVLAFQHSLTKEYVELVTASMAIFGAGNAVEHVAGAWKAGKGPLEPPANG